MVLVLMVMEAHGTLGEYRATRISGKEVVDKVEETYAYSSME